MQEASTRTCRISVNRSSYIPIGVAKRVVVVVIHVCGCGATRYLELVIVHVRICDTPGNGTTISVSAPVASRRLRPSCLREPPTVIRSTIDGDERPIVREVEVAIDPIDIS